jgi:thioredoxin 1
MTKLLVFTILFFCLLYPSSCLSQDNEKILLIFSAQWCKFCQNAQNDLNFNNQTLLDLSKNYKIIDINIDLEKEISKGHNIKTIPTFIIYENGKEVKRQVGYKNSKQLIEFLK